MEVEDDNESAGTRWRNTTTTATTETPGIYYEEHPQDYPHQLIMKLLQNFTAVPGLFDTGENRDLLRVVHHNNLDVDLEIINSGQQAHTVEYDLVGPSGLPSEGWWFSYKVHPQMFASAGAATSTPTSMSHE